MNNVESQNSENLVIVEFYSKYNIHNLEPFIVNLKCNKRSFDSLIFYRNKNFIKTKSDKRSLDNLIDHISIKFNNNIVFENIETPKEYYENPKVDYNNPKEDKDNIKEIINIKRSKSSNMLYNNLINDINKKYNIIRSSSETNLQIDKYIEELHVNFISYKEKFKKKNKNKKKISFCESVKVLLIPTKEEYKYHKLTEILWYCENDYRRFKNEFIFKLRNNFMEYDLKSISVKSPIVNNRKKI